MAIYKIEPNTFAKLPATTFAEVRLQERGDLQRLLRDQIQVLATDESDELLVIAEEFSDWDDSKRRIDLLAVDRQANLVVIELKRTDDGGHMELQAIRYAAMVSAMTFEQAVAVYANFLRKCGMAEDARTALLQFLGWEEAEEDRFAQDVRIVLVAADFSRELTTAVMWLTEEHDLDIRCVRLKPYQNGAEVLVDVQQVLPLPEAADYQVKLKEKQERERDSRQSSRDLTKYDISIGGVLHPRVAKRNAIYLVVRALCDRQISPERIQAEFPIPNKQLFVKVEGVVAADQFALARKRVDPRFDPTRVFATDDKLIHFNNATYALSNQWGGPMLEQMRKLVAAFSVSDIVCEEAK